VGIVVILAETNKTRVVNSIEEYKELITSIRDTLYRLALSIVVDSATAEDIVQDVSERVWRARDKVLHSEHPKAYICRMAHNLAIDRVRQHQRERSIALEGVAVEDGNSVSNIKDMAEITRKIIAQLPDKQQLIIHMRDVEGYEFEEIAQIAECDEVSVRMNLSRARKRVREELIKMMSYGVR
jgi:RNA polymerase sigma-70 factor (ECF subfamily)